MPKRDTDLLIGDMQECCFLIFEYTRGMQYADFVADRKTIDAVIRNVEAPGKPQNGFRRKCNWQTPK